MHDPKTAPERLWIFDFDGTLSSLVPDRDAAVILPEAGELLSVLSTLPGLVVAVISSRVLDDLIPRIGVEGLYLGGGSGAEWRLPGGKRRAAESEIGRLRDVRNAVMPDIEGLRDIPGIDVEDKKWSVAVHVRQARHDVRKRVREVLDALTRTAGIRVLQGPEVFEIPLMPGMDKLFGVRFLCTILRFEPGPGSLVYAGDDENDATAMEWVIRNGGVAYFVGREPVIPGVLVLEDPGALVQAVRRLAGLDVKG